MLRGPIAMQALRQAAAGSSARSTVNVTTYRGLATSSKSCYPRQVVRRSVPSTEVPRSHSPSVVRRQEEQTSSQSDLPWYLRAQAETPEGKELEAVRRARTRDVNELGEADSALPAALKGLHELLKTGAPSPLIARPDDGEVESETGRTPVTYIHARQHDEQSWCDWVVVVQVRTSSGSAVSRVAREIGAYLQTAQPPVVVENGSVNVKPAAKRPWRPYKILSREAQDGLRTLHAEDPERWSRKALAEAFKMSVESVRRILKSRWQPDSDVVARQNRRLRERREERWAASAGHEIQTREYEEVERIRTLIAQSNGARDQTQTIDMEDLNGDEYRTVNEDGTLADEEPRRQKVRYEGLVSTSHDGQQTQSKSANRVRSGVTRGDGEWCLVDAGWCVVHVMTARARTTYDVERQYLHSPHDESI